MVRKSKPVQSSLQHGVSGKTIPIVDVHSDSGSSIQANIKVSKLLPQRPAKRKATVDLSNMDLANENGHDLHEKNVKFSDGVVDHMNVQEGLGDSYHSSRSIFNDLTPRDLIQVVNKAGFILGYSQYEYDIIGATQNQVIYPSLDPSIFEIKFPTQDIKGQVVPL